MIFFGAGLGKKGSGQYFMVGLIPWMTLCKCAFASQSRVSCLELYSSLGEKLYDSVRKNVFMDLISPHVDQREGSVYV